MAKRGSTFGNFQTQRAFSLNGVKPIRTEFSRGSVPDSLYSVNRESAWTRWRRGYELAVSTLMDNDYEYPFSYQIPLPPGVTPSTGEAPTIPGAFYGFPTYNKEFGMHWAGVRTAGSLRFDNVKSSNVAFNTYQLDAQIEDYENPGLLFDEELKIISEYASIKSVTEDEDFWYVQLNGNWSQSNPLPPPLYVPVPGIPGGLKPINGEILEDRILEKGGVPITIDSINPNTQRRYGYVQAVLVNTDPFTGILTLRKQGSVEVTPDRVRVSPATKPPEIGRFFMTGSRYCCSCQDFSRREYAFMTNLNNRKNQYFPRSSIASVKPGRFEEMRDRQGRIDNNAMTDGDVNRNMSIIAPSTEYAIPPTITPNSSVVPGTTRDNPGVFKDFGSTYTRKIGDPSLPGSRADGMPVYDDYTATDNVITSITDYWTPLLDETRYCKHIYALKFREGVFPPEPSDFPTGVGNMTDWEQRLVKESEEKASRLSAKLSTISLSYMDVPPYNCQAPMMMPMMQKLFNIPSSFIRMQGFTMYDKEGNPYIPSLSQKPAV